MDKVMFVNYLSKRTPPELMWVYKKQHKLFRTSVLYRQKNGISSIIWGESNQDFFVEGLEKLKEIKSKYHYPIMYLDNDCVLMNPVDELFDNYEFDVAVVYRYSFRENDGEMGCLGGFLFFSQKRKDIEDVFLDKLIEKTKKLYQYEKAINGKAWWYDQHAINELIGEPPLIRNKMDYGLANNYEPCLKNVEGVKVLYVSANEWACPMAFCMPKNIKLFHYNHEMLYI